MTLLRPVLTILALALVAWLPNSVPVARVFGRNPEYAAKAVHVSELKSLVLRAGEMTSGVRSQVPTLVCLSGPCADAPKKVRCAVRGTERATGDPHWECTADLPVGVRFGSIDVSCEGFRYPSDEYITRGSCGLEYTLVDTSPYRQRQRDGAARNPARDSRAVHISEVNDLLFRQGETTTGLRAQVPSLVCVAGECSEGPEVVKCHAEANNGFLQHVWPSARRWKCVADLPDGLKFGSTEVSCEGFRHPGDAYITRGSCWLAYSLEGHAVPLEYQQSFLFRPTRGGWAPFGTRRDWLNLGFWALTAFLVYQYVSVASADPLVL